VTRPRPLSVQHDHGLRCDGLPCAGWAGGRPLHRQRTAGRVERRTGREDQTDPRRALARGRHLRRGARDPGPEGPRPGRLVSSSGRPAPDAVHTIGIIGTGVIGGGWAAHFLRMGYDVVAWDPAPDAEDRMSGLLDTAWPCPEALGLRHGASRDRLRFTDCLENAVTAADFVQESSPEVLSAKVSLLAAIDEAAKPWVVVGSSTSGLGM